MKFKEIKPGVVIHCPKEEDARALLEYLDDMGYIWEDTFDRLLDNPRYKEGDTYFLDYGKDDTEYRVTHDSYDWAIENGYTPTEFSNLIEPDENLANKANDLANKLVNAPNTSSNALNDNSNAQMSALEVLGWLKANRSTKTMADVFGSGYVSIPFEAYTPQEIIDKITAYEATKKEQKPVEVEFGWYCEILKMGEWGVMETVDQREMWEGDESTAMDEAAERAKQYAVENGVKTYFRVCGICRVKED